MSTRNQGRKREEVSAFMPLEEPTTRVAAPPQPVNATALWSAPMHTLMLISVDGKLHLIDAALWNGEREFKVLPSALQPVPSWEHLTSKVTPTAISELMLRAGIVNNDALVSSEYLPRFFQNVLAAYAEALRGAK